MIDIADVIADGRIVLREDEQEAKVDLDLLTLEEYARFGYSHNPPPDAAPSEAVDMLVQDIQREYVWMRWELCERIADFVRERISADPARYLAGAVPVMTVSEAMEQGACGPNSIYVTHHGPILIIPDPVPESAAVEVPSVEDITKMATKAAANERKLVEGTCHIDDVHKAWGEFKDSVSRLHAAATDRSRDDG